MMHKRPGCYHRDTLLKGRPGIPVDDTDRDAVTPFERLRKCRQAVFRIILRLNMIHALTIPVVGINLVERDTRLEDVDERKNPW